jgi:uncharacterized protein (UPF0264 family)
VNGGKYKLHGDMTRGAMEAFVRLAEEHGPALALKEYFDGREKTMILRSTNARVIKIRGLQSF